MNKTVIVDSDAIFAIFNPNDSLNTQATQCFQALISQDYELLYPTSVIFEVVSLFQRVLPTPTVTSKLIEMIKKEQIQTYIVDISILKEATLLFEPAGSKKNTLIDCSVVAIAKRIGACAIFSYDSFYTKKGLKLTEELFINKK